MGAEFRVRGVDSPSVVGDGNPGDVLCCVKTYMRDTVLQQLPLIVLPESQVGRVLQREPAGIVPPPRVFTEGNRVLRELGGRLRT
jgi:hypothetical protein